MVCSPVCFSFSQSECNYEIRLCTERALLLLVPEVTSYISLHPKLPEKEDKEAKPTEMEVVIDDATVRAPQVLSVEASQRLSVLLKELIAILKGAPSCHCLSHSLLDPRLNDMTGAERPTATDMHIAPPEAFRLAPLMRALEWTCVSSVEAQLLGQAWDAICALYQAMNRREIENDYNKHHLFKLIERMTLAEPSLLTSFASHATWIMYWITLRHVVIMIAFPFS